MVRNSWLLSLSLTLSLLGNGFQNPAGTDTVSCRVEGVKADILLAIDGSGSVTAYEFAMARGLLERLVGCLAVGPEGARLGLLQVAGRPVLELGLGNGTSREAVTRALHDMRQVLGDTNSGQALAYAARWAWAAEAGGRPGATRLLVWVTDGYSSDRLEGALGLLREARVLAFVVSTGRRDQGLSLVAGSPSRDFLFFTEIEQLPGLADRLCCTIRDMISPAGLKVSGVTAQSFTLSWGRMTIRESERYELEYKAEIQTQGGHPRSFELPWHARTFRVRGLQANTTYQVTLRVSGHKNKQQTRVTTLPGETGPSRIVVRAISPYILRLDWSPSAHRVQNYRILFGALSERPVRTLEVNGSAEGASLRGLRPDSSYLINLSALFVSGRRSSISVTGKTLPELGRTTKWPPWILTTSLGDSEGLGDVGTLPVTPSALDTSRSAVPPTSSRPSVASVSAPDSSGPASTEGRCTSLSSSGCTSEPSLGTPLVTPRVSEGEPSWDTTPGHPRHTSPSSMSPEGYLTASTTVASSSVTLPGTQRSDPTQAVTPLDGQQTWPTPAVTPMEGQTRSTSRVTTTDGQTRSTVTPTDGQIRSTVTPTDGQRRSTVTPTVGQRRSTSTVTPTDGQRRSTVTPTNGQTKSTSRVTPTGGQTRSTLTVTPKDGQQAWPTAVLTPSAGQTASTSTVTLTDSQQTRPTTVLMSPTGQTRSTSTVTPSTGQPTMATSILTSSEGQTRSTSTMTSSIGQQQRSISTMTSSIGQQTRPTPTVTPTDDQESGPMSIVTPSKGQIGSPSTMTPSNGQPTQPTAVLTSPKGQVRPTSTVSPSIGQLTRPTSILTLPSGQQIRSTSIGHQTRSTTTLAFAEGQRPSSPSSASPHGPTPGSAAPSAHRPSSAPPPVEFLHLTEAPWTFTPGQGSPEGHRPEAARPAFEGVSPRPGRNPGGEGLGDGATEPMSVDPRTPRTRVRSRVPKRWHPGQRRWWPAHRQDWQQEEERGRFLPPPWGLMLTDATPTSLVASWAPSPGRVLGYLLRHQGAGGEGSEVRLPPYVHQVTYRHLKANSEQSVCLRAVYSGGTSQALCARSQTTKDTIPRFIRCFIPNWF